MSKQEEQKITKWFGEAISEATNMAQEMGHEFILPEHLLAATLRQSPCRAAMARAGVSQRVLASKLNEYLAHVEASDGGDEAPEFSYQTKQLVTITMQMAQLAQVNGLDVPHLIKSIFLLEDSMANYLLSSAVANQADLMAELINSYESAEYDSSDEVLDEDIVNAFGADDDSLDMAMDDTDFLGGEIPDPNDWRQFVTCITDNIDHHNPLIGRTSELDRTIQVLCRKEKNNPLHVGEPGVGKTSLVYGLADKIRQGEVPERLKNCRIYQMDMGQMLAGTQFRGDFEKRLKQVMTGAIREGNAIIYLDEMHNIMGAGTTNEGGPDASNILKPYLESNDVRFIGSTTYEEYNQKISRSRGIVRRFQQIDILEPSTAETIEILKGLQRKYETFHHVVYRPEAIRFAVEASAKYIADRFLPDKAIDLIDEAGAYLELHPNDRKTQYVTKTLIEEMLQRVCKVNAVAMKEDGNEALKSLRSRIAAQIYGQDEAVGQVVEAIQMAKAGLLDDDKPLASLLFVGPTGVGKTEVARVLAHELGIELVRFDMSEYTEKHTVAKLIGSPAGYVGYEDGGLLTDAIRKTPNCVLLLDEIEKAHSDIYNILLQVMDYARLTDNKGQKADFRNVVLIMTSNAGAQYAGQANIGFSGSTGRGEAMLKQVKRTFMPEFINRLSGTVVFNEMDKGMATLILRKKLAKLSEKLAVRKVTMTLSAEATDYLLRLGFTKEYGAREMDRVIAGRLKPLLMREILFGKLKRGGTVEIGCTGKTLVLRPQSAMRTKTR